MFEKSLIKSKDSHKIPLVTWLPRDRKDIIGVVQLVHGKAEHIERYNEFATKLSDDGYVVIGHNHRGHGQEALDAEKLGHFADEDGWNMLLSDIQVVREYIGKKFKTYPVYCMGHSMGSFATRSYLLKHPHDFKGIVISGTGRYPALKSVFAKRLIDKKRRKAPGIVSEEIETLLFKDFNKTLNLAQTPFDWLSRDVAEVEKYIQDPLCGFASTPEFYLDLIEGMRQASRVSELKLKGFDSPMLFISGEQDPVGEWGKGFQKVVKKYERHFPGMISTRLYQGARHELTNELNRDEVYRDIVHWISEIK